MGNRIQVGLSLPDSLAGTLDELERVQGVPVAKLAVRLLEAAAEQFCRTGVVRLDHLFAEPAPPGEAAVGEAPAPYGLPAEFDARLDQRIRDTVAEVLAEVKAKPFKSDAAKAPRRAGAAAPLSRSGPRGSDKTATAVGA